MKKTIQFNGNEIAIEHVIKDTTKPTLVFLHDSLGCIKLWRDFPKRLAELTNLNYLVYDREGYGESSAIKFDRKSNYMELEANKLELLLSALKIDKVFLFGHSDGATISLIYAAKFPQKVLGIISEAAHVFLESITIKGIEQALHSFNTTNLEERLKKYHGNKVRDVFFAWTDIWTCEDYQSWNIEELLPKITCPTLVIQGTADEYGSLKQVESIVNNVSGKSEIFIPEGLAHTPHKEKPDLVLARSGEFINKLT